MAELVGPVDFHKDLDFWCQDKETGCFPVRWHIIKDVPNYTLQHILLQNNENKPVTHSRDTQDASSHICCFQGIIGRHSDALTTFRSILSENTGPRQQAHAADRATGDTEEFISA